MLMSGRGDDVAGWLGVFSVKTTRRGDGVAWDGLLVVLRKGETCGLQTAVAADAGQLGWSARCRGRASAGLVRWRWALFATFRDDCEVLVCEEGCTPRIAKRDCGIPKTLLLARGSSGGMRVRTPCDLSISPCLTAAFDGGGGGGNVVYCIAWLLHVVLSAAREMSKPDGDRPPSPSVAGVAAALT